MWEKNKKISKGMKKNSKTPNFAPMGI